jgi:uncharacterized phage infection (PIP) family protein YhgE
MDTTRERESTHDRIREGSTQDLAAAAEQMKSAARETGGHLAEEARDFAEQQRAAGADNVARLGRAVHEAADQIGKELPQAAGFIHSAADTLQTASSALRERSIEDMAASFSDFARRQPAAAFAGSVLAGFALARFLKSSSSREQRQPE